MSKWQEVKARIARAFTEEEPDRWVSIPLDELEPGAQVPEYYDPRDGEDPTADPEKGPRYYSDGRVVGEDGTILAFGISVEILTEMANREIGE
jgi:hypothetical protein